MARTTKRQREIAEQKNQRPVSKLTIVIEWYNSRTWGKCPRASVKIEYTDGSYERREGYKATGCGYDKASSVIAEIFGDVLRYKLWERTAEEWNAPNKPYGIYASDTEGREHRDYAPGIGVRSYYDIVRAIGGDLECLAYTNNTDIYRITMSTEG